MSQLFTSCSLASLTSRAFIYQHVEVEQSTDCNVGKTFSRSSINGGEGVVIMQVILLYNCSPARYLYAYD